MIFKLALIAIGGLVMLHGWTELSLSRQAAADPQAVELAALEAGTAAPDLHLRLGEHWKLWPELIYSYRLGKGESEGPETPISYAFYPVISDGHPYSQAVDRFMAAGYESEEDVPEEAWPVLESFAVLVRTEQFEHVKDLPVDSGWTQGDGLAGLVVNDVRSLDDDERSLLVSSYPGLDLAQVLILEEGRTPQSLAFCLALLAMGGVLVLLGVFWIVRSTTGSKPEAGELPPQLEAA